MRGCGKCGLDGNWACRLQCRGCGSRAPRSGATAKGPSAPPKAAAAAASKRERELQAKVAVLQAQVAAAKPAPPAEEPKAKGEDVAITNLRADIAKLEAAAHLLPEGLLDGKKVELDQLLQAKRAGRPLDARLREVQETVARRQKALEKQRAAVAVLKGQLEEVAKKLHEAEAEESALAGKLAEIEAVQVEIYRQKTVEAAVAANVALDPSPASVQALGLKLDKVKGEDLPNGVTKDQLVTALGIIAKLVGSDGAAPAAPGPAELPAAAGGQEAQAGGDDPIEDFDMEDADLLESVDAEEREAFKLVKVRLQERGLATSCSGRRRGLVRKEKK